MGHVSGPGRGFPYLGFLRIRRQTTLAAAAGRLYFGDCLFAYRQVTVVIFFVDYCYNFKILKKYIRLCLWYSFEILKRVVLFVSSYGG